MSGRFADSARAHPRPPSPYTSASAASRRRSRSSSRSGPSLTSPPSPGGGGPDSKTDVASRSGFPHPPSSSAGRRLKKRRTSTAAAAGTTAANKEKVVGVKAETAGGGRRRDRSGDWGEAASSSDPEARAAVKAEAEAEAQARGDALLEDAVTRLSVLEARRDERRRNLPELFERMQAVRAQINDAETELMELDGDIEGIEGDIEKIRAERTRTRVAASWSSSGEGRVGVGPGPGPGPGSDATGGTREADERKPLRTDADEEKKDGDGGGGCDRRGAGGEASVFPAAAGPRRPTLTLTCRPDEFLTDPLTSSPVPSPMRSAPPQGGSERRRRRDFDAEAVEEMEWEEKARAGPPSGGIVIAPAVPFLRGQQMAGEEPSEPHSSTPQQRKRLSMEGGVSRRPNDPPPFGGGGGPCIPPPLDHRRGGFPLGPPDEPTEEDIMDHYADLEVGGGPPPGDDDDGPPEPSPSPFLLQSPDPARAAPQDVGGDRTGRRGGGRMEWTDYHNEVELIDADVGDDDDEIIAGTPLRRTAAGTRHVVIDGDDDDNDVVRVVHRAVPAVGLRASSTDFGPGAFSLTGNPAQRLQRCEFSATTAATTPTLDRYFAPGMSASVGPPRPRRHPGVNGGGDPAPLPPSYPWSDQINSLLQDTFRIPAFRHHQREIVDHTLNGEDAFVIMRTGGGKSLTYQLPALLEGRGPDRKVTLVVSPLLSLIQDQEDQMNGFAKGSAVSFTSGLRGGNAEHTRRWRTVQDANAGVCLILVTPEKVHKSQRLRTELERLHDHGRLGRFV